MSGKIGGFIVDKIIEVDGKHYAVDSSWSDEEIAAHIAWNKLVDSCDLCHQKMKNYSPYAICDGCKLVIFKSNTGLQYQYDGCKYTAEEWQKVLNLKAFL